MTVRYDVLRKQLEKPRQMEAEKEQSNATVLTAPSSSVSGRPTVTISLHTPCEEIVSMLSYRILPNIVPMLCNWKGKGMHKNVLTKLYKFKQ